MKESSVDFCPVPTEQQPVNEYEQLKDSWFFRWATLDKLEYGRKLVDVWLWGWVIAGPITAASFPPQKYSIKFALCGSAGAILLVILVWLRLYLGWSYISDRLKGEKIFYEESGWYDGQTWKKPSSMVNRDHLIVSYQIKPILIRLQQTALILAGLLGIGSLIWIYLE